MTGEQGEITFEISRNLLGWEEASSEARRWWEELETLNQDRAELISKLTRQLLKRNATIDDFYLACHYSDREGVRENLRFLDIMFQDSIPKKSLDRRSSFRRKSLNNKPKNVVIH